MAADQDDPTLTDMVIKALNPVLIMVLVGSLAFFLLEVLYAGRYASELRWTLFFFVIGMVLIARITMTGEIAARSGCYAPILGLGVWLTMQRYITYDAEGPVAGLGGLINLALIGLIWWCAHCLTYDCTYWSSDRDQGDSGLMPSEGLFPQPELTLDAIPAEKVGQAGKKQGWWDRYQKISAQKKKQRVQGRWVVWFSLAALPLFGLGQSLIPLEETDRRQTAFWLMTYYIGSALGLLLTTRFLGLRRYLRQRKLPMPAGLTVAWLSMGAVLIGTLLFLGATLPRPHPEYPLISWNWIDQSRREASDYALRGEDSGEGKGQPGARGEPDEEGKTGNDNTGETSDEKGGDRKSNSRDKGENGQEGNQEKGNDSKKDGDKNSQEDNKGDGESSADKNKISKGQSGQKKNSQRGKDARSKSSSSKNPPQNSVSSAFNGLAQILKWLIFAIIAIVVLINLFRNGLFYLANFFGWARNLLQLFHRLFGGWFTSKSDGDARTEELEKFSMPEEPFASFRNPFRDGRARKQSVRQLLYYTYAALEAWSRENKVPRLPGETPLEFVGRLGEEVPALEDSARRLTNLFVRAAYASDELPRSCLDRVESFWQELEARDPGPVMTAR